MTTFYFSLTAGETVTGGAGTADFFYVNSFASFTTADVAIDPANGESTGQDIFAFNTTGQTFNIGSYSISGIETFVFGDYPNYVVSLSSAFTTANHDDLNQTVFQASATTNANSYAFIGTGAGNAVKFTSGAGADTLVGGPYADKLFGCDGNDTLLSENGADTLSGGSGDDTLFAGLAADSIDAGDGADKITLAYNDIATGDTILGGTGVDTILLDSAAAGSYDFRNAAVSLAGVEYIAGGSMNDSVALNLSQLSGMGGDVLGVDLGGGQDKVELSGVNVTLNLNSGVSFPNVEALVLNLNSTISIYAPYDTAMSIVNTSNYSFDYYGSTQGDSVWGGLNADNIYAGQGSDMVVGGDGGDNLFGNQGSDTIFGVTGADNLYGNRGDDVLLGGVGADYLYSGSGADTLYGGDGADVLRDSVRDGAGMLALGDALGESGNDQIFGNNGADTLFGGLGDDIIYGNSGADVILGGDGADCMYAGGGADVIWGGAGADTFFFYSGGGVDLVADFQPGIDKIAISGYTLFSTFATLQSVATTTVYGNGIVLTLPNGDVLSLVGAGATLNASDFVIN